MAFEQALEGKNRVPSSMTSSNKTEKYMLTLDGNISGFPASIHLKFQIHHIHSTQISYTLFLRFVRIPFK